MRWMVLFLVGTLACGFEPGGLSAPSDAPITAPDSRPGTPDAVGPLDAPGPQPCDGDNLRLCLRFGDALVGATAFDGSSSGYDADATTVNTIDRDDDKAVNLQLASIVHIPDPTSQLDIDGALSFGAWVNIAAYPAANTRFTVLDNNNQYGLFIQDDGKITCSFASSVDSNNDAMPVGEWSHIMCVGDGNVANAKQRVYLNGVMIKDENRGVFNLPEDIGGVCIGSNCDSSGPIALAGDKPDRLVGGLDEVQVWARALTGLEVCDQAGRSACPVQ